MNNEFPFNPYVVKPMISKPSMRFPKTEWKQIDCFWLWHSFVVGSLFGLFLGWWAWS